MASGAVCSGTQQSLAHRATVCREWLLISRHPTARAEVEVPAERPPTSAETSTEFASRKLQRKHDLRIQRRTLVRTTKVRDNVPNNCAKMGVQGELQVRSRPVLTPRDRALLITLTTRVRCLSLLQIQAHWWPEVVAGSRAPVARLKQLCQAGVLEERAMSASPRPSLLEPLICVAHGDPLPAFGALAHRLKHRFGESARTERIYFATSRAAAVVGGHAGRAPRPAETTHDLALAGVFLRFLATMPKRAAGWQSETALILEQHGGAGMIPDALILEQNGRSTAIELGGQYDVEKLASFHQACRERGWDYELW